MGAPYADNKLGRDRQGAADIMPVTNAIESLNMQLRKITKNRGHFPSDEAATKLLYLALRNVTAKWKKAAREWKAALSQFAILFEDRFVAVGM
jgi:transposase-like protein